MSAGYECIPTRGRGRIWHVSRARVYSNTRQRLACTTTPPPLTSSFVTSRRGVLPCCCARCRRCAAGRNRWMVVDCGNVIVNLFEAQVRRLPLRLSHFRLAMRASSTGQQHQRQECLMGVSGVSTDARGCARTHAQRAGDNDASLPLCRRPSRCAGSLAPPMRSCFLGPHLLHRRGSTTEWSTCGSPMDAQR